MIGEQERRVLLKNWLRGKGLPPASVEVALNWCSKETEAGRKPDDKMVLSFAAGQYETQYAPPKQTSFITQYEITWRLLFLALLGSFLGNFLATALWSIYKTWVLAQTLLLL